MKIKKKKGIFHLINKIFLIIFQKYKILKNKNFNNNYYKINRNYKKNKKNYKKLNSKNKKNNNNKKI